MFQCMCIFIYSNTHISWYRFMFTIICAHYGWLYVVTNLAIHFVRGAVRRAKHPSLGAEDLDGQRVTWRT